MSDLRAMGPDRWFLAFAASVFVFHQVPAFAGEPVGDWIDLLTPVAVAGTSAGLIVAFGIPRGAAIVALVAALLYVHGQGIHLAANSIHNEDPVGRVEEVTYFWDERFSHIEALLGWFGLVGAFCLAERAAPAREMNTTILAAAAVLLGWTFFTSTVEGQTWPLQLAAMALFAGSAVRARRRGQAIPPLLGAAAAAFALGALLIGVWAAWHGGVPE
ncbi:MAG: hypothetical protein ACRDKY_05235, partial [Solirubrobacteraceae bacterium]